MPFEHTVTAPSGCIPSAAVSAEYTVYYIKPDLFEPGKPVLQTPAGKLVPSCDFERTVCDMVHRRSKIGTETFLSALKQYAARSPKDVNRLAGCARQTADVPAILHSIENSRNLKVMWEKYRRQFASAAHIEYSLVMEVLKALSS